MKRHVPAGTLVCSHCTEPVIDGQSPTGLVHEATRRVRCDGKRAQAPGAGDATLAVAA